MAKPAQPSRSARAPAPALEAAKGQAPASKRAPRKSTTATPPAPESSASPASPAKTQKHKKPKLVRDSFTFPQDDYALFGVLKRRALESAIEVKKSELLRAGLSVLAAMSKADLLATIGRVERIKTGRPGRG
jgi:hypothetical protein